MGICYNEIGFINISIYKYKHLDSSIIMTIKGYYPFKYI